MSPPQGGLIIYAMRIVLFPLHSPAHVVPCLDELPPAGLVWIDCLRNEAAVQLHFAVATERTNRVVQTLTVISAIFFPLTLITGLYGMNFQHMPELAWRYGYFIVLGVLLAIGAGLLLLFKRRGYF